MIDIGIHIIDTLWWLAGCPKPISVMASTYRAIDNYRIVDWDQSDPAISTVKMSAQEDVTYDVEDSAFAFVRFEKNLSATFAVSWALNTNKDSLQCHLYGKDAGMTLWPISIYGEEHGHLSDKTIGSVNNDKEAHFAEIQHFIECVREQKDSISPPEQGVTVMKMIDAIYRSAEGQREIRLD